MKKNYKISIGYLYNDVKVKLLKYNASYGQTKLIHFLIKDDELLEKYNTISDKVSTNIKKNMIV